MWGLEIEIPNTGDYKLSFVGERQVVMVRDRVAPKDRGTDTGIRVVETAAPTVACASPAAAWQRAQLCLPIPPVDVQAQWRTGGPKPFKDGGRDGDCINGGMPADS